MDQIRKQTKEEDEEEGDDDEEKDDSRIPPRDPTMKRSGGMGGGLAVPMAGCRISRTCTRGTGRIGTFVIVRGPQLTRQISDPRFLSPIYPSTFLLKIDRSIPKGSNEKQFHPTRMRI